MNQKKLFILSLLFMISFSTGVFAQIISTDQISVSTETASFWPMLFSSLKSDSITILIAMILTVSVFLAPCVLLLAIAKVFALGFTAAYLLASHPQGLPILFAVLLPRCIIRIPAYAGLTITVSGIAKAKDRRNRRPRLWLNFGFCAAALFLASLIEACLYLLVS